MEHIIFGFCSERVLNRLVCFLHTQGDSVHISLHGRVALFKASVQQATLLISVLRLCLLRGRVCVLLSGLFGKEPFKIRFDSRLFCLGALARHFTQNCVHINPGRVHQFRTDCFGAVLVGNLLVAADSVIKKLNQLHLRFRHVLIPCLDGTIYLLDGCRVCAGRHLADSCVKHHIIGDCFLVAFADINGVEFCLTHDVIGLLLGFLLVLERARGHNLAVGGCGIDCYTSIIGGGLGVASHATHREHTTGEDIICFGACGLAYPAVLHEFFHCRIAVKFG